MEQDRDRTLLEEVDAACRELADPKPAAKSARHFTEGCDACGTKHDAAAWIERKRSWFEDNRDLGLDGFPEFGKDLFATGKYEHGALAAAS